MWDWARNRPEKRKTPDAPEGFLIVYEDVIPLSEESDGDRGPGMQPEIATGRDRELGITPLKFQLDPSGNVTCDKKPPVAPGDEYM